MASRVRPVPAKYKLLGKHVVVEAGYSTKGGKKVPAYRIIGEIWGRG